MSLPGAGQALGRGPGSWSPGLPSHWSSAVIITPFHMALLTNGEQKSGRAEIGVLWCQWGRCHLQGRTLPVSPELFTVQRRSVRVRG